MLKFKRNFNYYLFSVLIFCAHVFPFTIEELKGIHYEVEIFQSPLKKDLNQPVMYMTSKYGQQYQCALPQLEDDDVSEKETVAEKNTDVKQLLKPMQSGSCLLKGKDWWTYEFCFGHYIKQFHIEDGQILGQVITLGLYESDYDWNNETDLEKFKHVKQKYHSQFYTNGTKCDLTGQPRNAEIRFFCEEDAGDYIHRVDEPGTCSYIITVHTSRLCAHPQLKPLPSHKAYSIPCHPVLNEEQYSQYLLKLKEENALAEEKRIQWLNNQHERLQLMKQDIYKALKKNTLKDLNEKPSSKNAALNIDQPEVLNQDAPTLEVKIEANKDPVKVGDMLELHCKVTGDQSASISWQIVGQNEPLPDNVRTHGPLLIITGVMPENDGVYRCNVESYAGTFSEVYVLALQAKNTLAEKKENEELNTQEETFQFMKNNGVEDHEKLLKDPNSKNTALNSKLLEIFHNEFEKLKSLDPSGKLESLMKQNKPIQSETEDLDLEMSDEKESKASLQTILQKMFYEVAKFKELKSEIFSSDDETSSVEDPGKDTEVVNNEGETDDTSKKLKPTEEEKSSSAVLDDDKLYVRIRRLDRKSVDPNSKLYEMDVVQKKKLEQALKEKLEKAGLDTGGRRIEVNIITAGFFDYEDGKDFHSLSDEETSQFQNMIMALLTGQQEAVQEMERHKKQEENYKFTWQSNEDEKDD